MVGDSAPGSSVDLSGMLVHVEEVQCCLKEHWQKSDGMSAVAEERPSIDLSGMLARLEEAAWTKVGQYFGCAAGPIGRSVWPACTLGGGARQLEVHEQKLDDLSAAAQEHRQKLDGASAAAAQERPSADLTGMQARLEEVHGSLKDHGQVFDMSLVLFKS